MTPSSPLVFITGASSGIGQALAGCFFEAGYCLALLARRTDAIESWAAGRGIPSARLGVYGADVANVDAIVAAGQAVVAAQGLPDIVIANAGISVGVDGGNRADLEVLAQTFAVNNVGLAATFQPFVEAMRARGSGRLVGIASVAGVRGLPGHGAYCASKAGVIAYCESLRGELRDSGVKVVTICPGYIDTPLTQGNRYGMPFLMQADAFAERSRRAIEAGDSLRFIPWQMGIIARLMKVLPNAWYDRLAAGRGRKRRRGQ
ncbi:MAG: SDR family oxidoreductase [Rubrivivax sp.]